MNQKITTLLGSVILLIIAITAVYFLWISDKTNQFEENSSQLNKKQGASTEKPDFEDTTPVKADSKLEDLKIVDSLPPEDFKFAIGKLKEFDKKKILIVETEKESVKIIIDERTVIYSMPNEKMEAKTVDDIKAGQEISCQYHNDPDISNRTATSVMLGGHW